MVTKTSKQAIFRGTFGDYHYHIGPSIRNRIQAMTRSRRRGRCATPGCNYHGTLDAAHKPDRTRPTIIEEVLRKYIVAGSDGVVECNLNVVLHEIEDAHADFDRVFDFICKPCHNKQGTALATRQSSISEITRLTTPAGSQRTDEVVSVAKQEFVSRQIPRWSHNAVFTPGSERFQRQANETLRSLASVRQEVSIETRRGQILQAISRAQGTTLRPIKARSALFIDRDRQVRAVCAVSKRYTGSPHDDEQG